MYECNKSMRMPTFLKKMASSHSRFAFSLFLIHTHTHVSAHVSKEHESLCSNNKPYEFVKELIKTRSRQDSYMRDYYALKKVREAKWVPLQRQALQSGKEVNEAMPRLNPHSKKGAWHPLKGTSYKIVRGPTKKKGVGGRAMMHVHTWNLAKQRVGLWIKS